MFYDAASRPCMPAPFNRRSAHVKYTVTSFESYSFCCVLMKKKKNRFPWNFLQVEKFSCIPGRIRSATLFWFNSDQMTKCSSLQKRQTDHSLLHALGYQRPLRKGSRYLHIRSWAFGHALAKIPQFLWSMAP